MDVQDAPTRSQAYCAKTAPYTASARGDSMTPYVGSPPGYLDLSQWSEIKLWSADDRVTTPIHGAGTVLGPEFIEDDGHWHFLRRWAVLLDETQKHYRNDIAYYWDRDLTRIPT